MTDHVYGFETLYNAEKAKAERLCAVNDKLAESLQNAVALWAYFSTDAPQRVWLDQARAALAAAGEK